MFQTDIKNATDLWTVTYEADEYPMGTYIVNVVVKNCVLTIVCYEVASARSYFVITGEHQLDKRKFNLLNTYDFTD